MHDLRLSVMNSCIFCDSKPTTGRSLLAGFMLGLFFNPDDQGDEFLRDVFCLFLHYTASYSEDKPLPFLYLIA
jgi:hypothetical protein